MDNNRQAHQVIEDEDPYAQAQQNLSTHPKKHLSKINSHSGLEQSKERH